MERPEGIEADDFLGPSRRKLFETMSKDEPKPKKRKGREKRLLSSIVPGNEVLNFVEVNV